MIIRVQLYIYLHLTARPIIHIELLIRRITFPLQENRTVSLLLCLSILLATIHNGNAERKIVCYYTNWSIYRPGTAKFSPQNINPYLCTHLIYAFGGFTKDNALKPFDKYQDIEKGIEKKKCPKLLSTDLLTKLINLFSKVDTPSSPV